VLDDYPPKATMLGLGPPKPPSPPKPSSANVMHDYASEDEDIVTTVMSSPLEEQEANTASISISTVHEPAKSQRPQAVPDDAIVVAPTLLGAHEQQVQYPPMTMPTAQHQQYQQTVAPGYASAAPTAAEQQRSSVLIAVIAAATTLIALTLTALVVLKITESPKDEQARTNGTQLPPPPSLPATVAGTAPGTPAPSITVVPVPTAAPPPTMEGAVNPESLPKETAAAKPATPTPTPVAGGGPKPTPATGGGVPAPIEKPATPGKGEPGFLTVMCVPACDSVTAGGRSLGPSPVVRAALPPGNHGVGLRAGSKKKSLSVTITSGQTTARRVTMD
jgi:hypothetical protein